MRTFDSTKKIYECWRTENVVRSRSRALIKFLQLLLFEKWERGLRLMPGMTEEYDNQEGWRLQRRSTVVQCTPGGFPSYLIVVVEASVGRIINLPDSRGHFVWRRVGLGEPYSD